MVDGFLVGQDVFENYLVMSVISQLYQKIIIIFYNLI